MLESFLHREKYSGKGSCHLLASFGRLQLKCWNKPVKSKFISTMQKHLEKEKKKKKFYTARYHCWKLQKKESEETVWISANYLYPAAKCSRTESEEYKHVHLTLAFHLAMLIHFICNGGLRWKHLALNSSPWRTECKVLGKGTFKVAGKWSRQP